MSLLPIFAKDVLHGGASMQGLLTTIIGMGSVLGSLGVAAMQRRYSSGRTVVIGACAFGVTLFGFASAREIMMSSLWAFGMGLSVVMYQTQTLLQLLAPRHIRGRVMSIFLLNLGLVPLGTLLAGALAEHLGGPRALQILSLAVLGVVLLVVLLTPRVLTLQVALQGSVPTH